MRRERERGALAGTTLRMRPRSSVTPKYASHSPPMNTMARAQKSGLPVTSSAAKISTAARRMAPPVLARRRSTHRATMSPTRLGVSR